MTRAKTIPSYSKWMGENKKVSVEELKDRKLEHDSLVVLFEDHERRKDSDD